MPKVIFRDLGHIGYQKAWDYQSGLHNELKNRKLDNRKRLSENREFLPQNHYLLFCEHPPVYTLGKSGSIDHLLLNEKELKQQGFDFFKINRGGDITYHGPGQIVGYPIFDLDDFFTDVHKYVRFLEEAVILTLEEYGLKGMRMPGFTGVWLSQTKKLPKRKICAIGVHLSRWVTMHGFAFNVNTDLSHFNYIVPCGIDDADKSVTSMATELGEELNLKEVKDKLKKHFSNLFKFEYIE